MSKSQKWLWDNDNGSMFGDLNTHFAMLKRAKKYVNTLGFGHTAITFDMELLKASEVQWSWQKELFGVVFCNGGMHCIMSVISTVGYMYAEPGLKCILHGSDVFGAGKCSIISYLARMIELTKYFTSYGWSINKLFFYHVNRWCTIRNQTIPVKVIELLYSLAKHAKLHKLTEILMKLCINWILKCKQSCLLFRSIERRGEASQQLSVYGMISYSD